jgi:DNA-binding response OmpR family regulator
MAQRRIGDVLVSRRVVTGAMITAALGEARRRGERVCSVLLRHGVEEGRLAGALAELHGTPGVDLSRSVVPLEVLSVVPAEVARGDLVLPISREGGRIHVAVASPESATPQVDEVRLSTGQEVSVYVAVHASLSAAIEAAYSGLERGDTLWSGHAATAAGPHVERCLAVAFARPPAPAPATRANLPVPPGGAAIGRLKIERGPVPAVTAAASPAPPPLPARRPAALVPPPTPPEAAEEFEVEAADLVEDAVELGMAGGGPAPELPPAAAAAAERAEPPVLEVEPIDDGPPDHPDGRRRVLVVDDEPEVARLACKVLEKAGFATVAVGDGEAALAEAQLRRPDLVLLDAMLPRLHGFEVCMRLRADPRTRHIPVIIMTAVYRGWRFADDAREAYGAEDYIEKPFAVEDLRRRVEAALDRREGQRVPAPDFVAAYRRGREAFRTGDHAGAVRAFEEALAVDPFSPEAHAALGLTLRAAGDRFRAMTMLERAVELRPQDLTSLQALANVYDRNGFFRKAIEALERALAAAKDEVTRDGLRADLMGRLNLEGAPFGS